MSAKKNIIVLDDEKSIHYVFDRVLGKEFNVLHAYSIKDAMTLAYQEKDIDLVVTDVFLGGETGVELVSQIREFGPRIPVIIMSAFADEMTQKVIQSIKKTFSCEFMKKPFDNDQMEALVRQMLDS